MKNSRQMLLRRAFSLVFSLSLLSAAGILSSCSESTPIEPAGNNASAYNAAVPNAWFQLQLELVQKTPGFSPPVASRAFGYSGVTLYQALLSGMPNRKTLEGQLNGLAVDALPKVEDGVEYHWPTVANAALARITSQLYANATTEMSGKITALEDQFVSEFLVDVDGEVVDRSVAYGKSVANAIFEWSKTDGGHEGYKTNFPTTYTPPSGSGLWVPTPRRGGDPQSALQPYWGSNRPFILNPTNPNEASEPGAPPAFSEDPSSAFYAEANEVYTTISNLTQAEKDIALYWSDDPGLTCTPPGHSISILTECLEQTSKQLDFAAVAYAQVGMAVADAFIACWESKYRYNLVRPITYIVNVIDPAYDYNDLPVNTPPFPEYTSGHSVQSGATAEVLTSLFGNSFSFTDHTHDQLGYAARSYTSFYEAADEAAISRLYGGIHYRAAIENGVDQGKKVGGQVIQSIDWGN
ncbi:MAG: vanadium-dependent haloperoxidase [Ignavibacteriae bacterium]|nr:vanadium-dependent haloperoxidase [Ignavibacteriota bacterium]MCB9217455.1 vanadium-dependent haloperoxidase [Ignavibacteria bacterium]